MEASGAVQVKMVNQAKVAVEAVVEAHTHTAQLGQNTIPIIMGITKLDIIQNGTQTLVVSMVLKVRLVIQETHKFSLEETETEDPSSTL